MTNPAPTTPSKNRPASIAFIGFGEAGRAFQEGLAAREPGLAFTAYDILLDDQRTAGAMREAMVQRKVNVVDKPSALGNAGWIFSAVTADQSLRAIEALAPGLRPEQLVIDINSVSPGRKRDSAALVEAAGAGYLDMAVMAPVVPAGHTTPVLIAGRTARTVLTELERLGFNAGIAGDEPGAATAIKMARSLFVKGLEAVTVEALLAAEASGCLDAVLHSLKHDFAMLGWPDFATYRFERTTRHGGRRAAEMRECAATLRELGLNAALAAEIAEVQEKMAGIPAPASAGAPLQAWIEQALGVRLGLPTSHDRQETSR
jgi:3-hydroxyisobutyrate dehydrogenase-like beta-hydroxyacid dehydrogenase